MLQEVLAGWLQIKPGHYHHVSDSLHVYDRDLVSLSQQTSVVSADSDVFALPRKESDAAIASVVKAIEEIINEHRTAAEISRLADATSLPETYRNALRVMIAEGARRRKDTATADTVMAACTSVVFCQMWSDWCDRLKAPK
jgi:thymidylate synthase